MEDLEKIHTVKILISLHWVPFVFYNMLGEKGIAGYT